jgi:hypothetical protein
MLLGGGEGCWGVKDGFNMKMCRLGGGEQGGLKQLPGGAGPCLRGVLPVNMSMSASVIDMLTSVMPTRCRRSV